LRSIYFSIASCVTGPSWRAMRSPCGEII
jgi:hypothetical protein